MKKIFSILAMAAVVLCMASCAFGGSDRYKDGERPVVDEEKSTINGIYHENQTNHCYAVVLTHHVGSSKHEEWIHHWCTEFEVVEAYEWLMWAEAQSGVNVTYGMSITNYDDVKCEEQEDFEGLPSIR